MKIYKKYFPIVFLVAAPGLLSCIHEYPRAIHNPAPGNDPTQITATIKVSFDLNWQQMLHVIDFSSRAADSPHRFMIEVRKDGEIICCDTEYISDEGFAKGELRHNISVPLANSQYDVAIWYDREGLNGVYPFNADDLSNLYLDCFSTTENSTPQCAFAAIDLDLREYGNSKESVSVIKEVELDYPGCRFEIIATDVQEFIIQHKEALNQGDYYNINLSFATGAYPAFNLYLASPFSIVKEMEYSGRMRLPFAEYDSLKIAEGFFFCHQEDEATLKLYVTNSALSTVSETSYFSIPVKRGFITVISGDFLTHPVDGVFNVNNVWEGEIVFEI